MAKTLRHNFLLVIVALIFCFSFSPSAYPAQVTLKWDPSGGSNGDGEASVVGYRVYYGTSSGKYETSVDVGTSTEYEVNDLEAGKPYYFGTTAYDALGNESDFSNEIGYDIIDLTPGWNLISLPLQPSDTSIEEVLKKILAEVSFVMTTGAEGWLSYTPGNLGGSTLKTMEAGLGYWIMMADSGTLEITGFPASQSINLLEGWNSVGYNSPTALSLPVALQSIADKVLNVMAYENGEYKIYDPNVPSGTTLTQFSPGRGYYIQVNQDATWDIP